MKLIITLAFALMSFVHSAPQLISFKEGHLGVNFGGYHAGVGLGGLLGGGTAGGLYAEAGTPQGQAAKAGLGGVVDAEGHTSGGLYAGATAGGDVKASAGLAGGVGATKTAGTGYAVAQAGDHVASSGLGGESSVAGSTGFTFSGSKSFGISTGVVKEKEVQPVEVVQPIEIIRPAHKKVHAQINVDAVNEVQPSFVPLETEVAKTTVVEKVKEVQPTITVVKEVYVPPPVVEKHITYVQQPVVEKHVTHVRRYKPHHFHKSAYVGGYFGGFAPPPPPAHVVYHTAPAIEKRVDVAAESAANVGADYGVQGGGVGQVGYTKTLTYQRNPNFFSDIFNIPIQTLKAVGNFLGNSAGSANISVQKTASVHSDAESISSKHAPLSSSSSVSSIDTKVSVDTSPAAKIIDDILAIPINTLGAVNKFLENNVPTRKKVQITEGEDVPTRVRLGPHARRRANKHSVLYLQDDIDKADATVEN